MKKLYLLTWVIILCFAACKTDRLDETVSDAPLFRSELKLLGLDKVQIIPNETDINKLLRNPDDASDEKITNLLYELGEAIKPLATDYNFNAKIIELARGSNRNVVYLNDLKSAAIGYYNKIDHNLSSSGLSIRKIESQMVYNNPDGSKSEQYYPGIHIPNLNIADAKRQPLVSAQLEYIDKDELMDDFILCSYHIGEGGWDDIWVGEHTADVTTNPIFVFDNLEKLRKSAKSQSSKQIEKSSFKNGLKIADNNLEKTNDIEYNITQYKIAHRYDNSRHSEYSYELVYFLDNGGTKWGGLRSLIKRIHKNDINDLFYDNVCIWEINYQSHDIATVGLVTFEYDWYASKKTMFVNSTGVGCRTKYSSHWYQKFPFDYNGSDYANSSKGYIKLESDEVCTDCPPGYGYDGANCWSGMEAPPGYNIFIYGTSFYVQQNCSISTANSCCPDGFGFDSANCHSGINIPTGWIPFVYDRKFYVQPQCL